jgi:hypothetical protein
MTNKIDKNMLLVEIGCYVEERLKRMSIGSAVYTAMRR